MADLTFRRRRDALRIVLLGKTGAGKSATGNTILDKDAFRDDASVTTECSRETAEVNGRQITVIDTPGQFDTGVGNVEIQKEITKCIFMAAPGPHVFLLVLKVGQRFSEEEKGTVEIIQNMFGEESVTYTMLLFTGADLPKDMILQYFGDPGSDIRNLIEQCGNRIHFFNNKQIRNRMQVTVLLEKIDSMLAVNGGNCYTNEMFQQAEKEKQEREKEELRVRYEAEILNRKKDEKKFAEREKLIFSQLESLRRSAEEKSKENDLQLMKMMEEQERMRKSAEEKSKEKDLQLMKTMEELERVRKSAEEKSKEKDLQLMKTMEELERVRKSAEEKSKENDLQLMKMMEEQERMRKSAEEKSKEKDLQLMKMMEEQERMRKSAEEKSKEKDLQLMKTMEELESVRKSAEEKIKEKDLQLMKMMEELESVRKSSEEKSKEKDLQLIMMMEELESVRKSSEEKSKEKELQLMKMMEELESVRKSAEEKIKEKDLQLMKMMEELESVRKSSEEKSKEKDLQLIKTMEELERVRKSAEEKSKEKDLHLMKMMEELERVRKSAEEKSKEKDLHLMKMMEELERVRKSAEEKSKEKGLQMMKMMEELESVRKSTEEKSKEKDLQLMKTMEELESVRKSAEEKSKEKDLHLMKMTEELERVRKSAEEKSKEKDLQLMKMMEELERVRKSAEEKSKEKDLQLMKMMEELESVRKSAEEKSKEKDLQMMKMMEQQERRRVSVEEKFKKMELQLRMEVKEMERKISESQAEIKELRAGKASDTTPGTSADYTKQVQSEDQSGTLKNKGEDTHKTDDTHQPNEETKKQLDQLFTKLHLQGHQKEKLTPGDVLQVTAQPLVWQESCTEKELVQTFLQRLLLMDYRARYILINETGSEEDHVQSDPRNKKEDDTFFSLKSVPDDEQTQEYSVHPMDVQMAVFHCSDNFLKQLIVTKLSQCQYALPLLVPDPFTREIEFPLWTFRQIRKSWKTSDPAGKTSSKTRSICEAETPMVAFFRFGSISLSKSELMNRLINEKHDTFFHRDCPGSSRNRLLMDGVVEIAWYCPSGKSTDHFTDCVAFCNLHGDAETHEKQLEILTEMSSVNVVVLDKQGDILNKQIIQKLCNGPKPLVFILCEATSNISVKNLKYEIGIKNKGKADVSKNLKRIINDCTSKLSSTFNLNKLGKIKELTKDEDDESCQKGKDTAMQIMTLLERTELSEMKESSLPHQGKLWREWCKKKKELHRLQGPNLEMQRSEKRAEMKKNREQQHKLGLSKLMDLFTRTLKTSDENEKSYFLKWLGILLDNFTTDELSGFRHAYDQTWSKVLDLKRQTDKSEDMKNAQTQLKEISKKLSAAAFGIEHIFREMGQIYEACMAVEAGKNYFFLPKLAAESMLSGHPLELMDGDTGHVPLVWVSAVLDELINKLGDQRVFVLSVLGIQSTGKSTMLNAMFGLQFAVSAGRCTKGAFMQMVKVSDETKKELNLDYIFVVDTEGLRSLELTGISTRQLDNGLATFVVGLGNMTLINICGENPSEMQDILQIVVQAFLRMKKVSLNPRCMFVHQNVDELTAGEKNMEGRKCFLDILDEMTTLAAEEEDFNAKCFSDVLTFDVQSDVSYFAQLWEGSPPMAPPNPFYCENIQELKGKIISTISPNSGVTFSQFKQRLSSLWNALLNENVVFSFRNTLEIAVYRRLEHEYSKWTWSLRSAMLATENKLHNRVTNEDSIKIDEEDIAEFIKKAKTDVETSIKKFFDEDRDKEILIQWRERFQVKISELCSELVQGTKRKLDEVIRLKKARKKVDSEKKMYEIKLFKLFRELAFYFKNRETEEDALQKELEDVWSKWVNKLTFDTPQFADINIRGDVTQILSESYEHTFVTERQHQEIYKRIDALGNYSDYVILKNQEDPGQEDLQSRNEHVEEEEDKNACGFGQFNQGEKCAPAEESSRTSTVTGEDNNSLSVLIRNTAEDIKAQIRSKTIAEHGYSRNYIPEIISFVKDKVTEHESNTSNYTLRKEFTVDLCLSVCDFAADYFTEQHKEFKESYDVRIYLERQKPQYFNIFKDYCSGATSTAVFGRVIVETLNPSIVQAAYDQTAIDLSDKMKCDVPAFSGNKSNQEKHILTSLAEEENFENYIEYIQKPKEYCSRFIKKKVDEYIYKENENVLEIMKSNISSKVKRVMDAVNEATEEVKRNNGDANMWLQHLSKELQDELQLKEKSYPEQNEVSDFEFFKEIVNTGLTSIMSELNNRFQDISDLKWEMFRKKPEDILIEQLCRCCWAQCPFCNAICTNTLENHSGDHSVRFHRNPGINGWSFKFTDNLGIDFCTTFISSKVHFYANGKVLSFKDYRKAGGEYAKWNITPGNSEMPYWKWFVCRFQKDLENHYKKQFTKNGENPNGWRDYSKDQAIESLKEL